MNKGHVSWIDAYKGVLILLVVIGHTVGGGIHLMPEGMVSRTVAEYVFKFIYSFHMPAFFFVAGVTFGLGNRKTFSVFLRRKAERLLVPYFVFGIVSGVLYLIMSGSFDSTVATHATDVYYANKTGIAWWVPFAGLAHGGGWPNGQGFIANSVLWFLPCLFTVEIAYYILDRAVRNPMGQLLIAGVLLLSVQPLQRVVPSGLPWGLSKLPYYLPFMIMGRWMPPVVGTERRALAMGMVLLVIHVGGVILTPNAMYASRTWGWSLLFSGLAIVGIGTLFFLIGIADWRMVRIWGAASMTIMLLHKFLVIFLQLKVPLFRGMSAQGGWRMAVVTAVVSVAAVAFCIAANWLIRRFTPWMLGEGASSGKAT